MDRKEREYEQRRLQEQRAREYQHHVELYRQHFMHYGYPAEPQWGHTMGPPMQGHHHHGYPQPQQHMHMEYQHPLQHPHPGIMQGVPLPPGIPGLGGSTDPLEAVLGQFPCAQLKNLPYDASLEDILVLFQGLVVIDVILVGNGEAFAIFANPMDFQMALQRDRQPLGRQFVEISSASRDEYYAAIAKQHMQEQEGGRRLATVVGATAVSGEEGGGEEQKPSGETASSAAAAALWGGAAGSPPMSSLATASSYGDSMASQQPPHGHTPGMAVGGRGGGGPSRGGLHAPLQKRTGGGIQVGEHTGFLRMRGLPFSATKEDIFKFFQGYNPVQESIVLTYRNDGRATGEAYVGFASPDDSKRAMELHRRSMGSRYIELFISNKDEQGRALARFGNR